MISTVEIPTRTLVLGMMHRDGALPVAEALPVANACGVRPEPLRSCLRRLVSEGLFERVGSGRGREACFVATPRGFQLLARERHRLRRARAIAMGEAPWDRLWHWVAFAIPETVRSARDGFRDRLRSLGGAPLQGGLYMSANPWERSVRAAAKELAVASHITLGTSADLEIAGAGEPQVVARRLWPLATVAASYSSFVDRFREVPATLAAMRDRGQVLPDEAFLPAALSMAVEWARCFEEDPLLPRELLPGSWPGFEAHELLVTARRGALALREAQGRPPLFHSIDDLFEDPPDSLPSL